MREKRREPAKSAVYGGPEGAIRAMELLLGEMQHGTKDPEEVKKEVAAAGEEYARAVDYCIDADDVNAAKRICRVMEITDKVPLGRWAVAFLHEKARVLSGTEAARYAHARRYGNCYESILNPGKRLYSWLYENHREVLAGEAVQKKRATELPGELATEKARLLLDAATKEGLCKCEEGLYKWGGSLALLAYFADKASGPDALGISKREDGNGVFAANWVPFETLFGIKHGKLCRAKSEWRKRGGLPKGREKVDEVFKQCGYNLHPKRK